MRRFSNILLALHEGCDGAAAIDWAAFLAQQNQAALHVIEVIEPFPRDIRARIDLMRPILRGDPERSAVRRRTAQLRKELASVREQGICGQAKAVLGFPWEVVVDASREIGCDLVILPTRPSRGLTQWLLGGADAARPFGRRATDKLLRRLDCPSMILNLGSATSAVARTPNGRERQPNGGFPGGTAPDNA